MTKWDKDGHVVFSSEDRDWLKSTIEEMRSDNLNKVADLLAESLAQIKDEE